MPEPKICDCCRKSLSDANCTFVTETCDDCLANQAADDRIESWENGSGYE